MDKIPPLGAKGYTLQTTTNYEPVKVHTDRNSNILMENKYIQATFDKSGHLIGLLDKILM